MSFVLGTARGTIEVVAKLAGIDETLRAFDQFKKESAATAAAVKNSWEESAKAMTTLGQRMSLAITAPLVVEGRAAIMAASDLNEAITATNATFGEAAQTVIEFAE